MPSFTTIRETLKIGQKLSTPELVRALRFSIAAEYEAIQVYEQIVECISDKKIMAVIRDIIDEEKIHAGQFMDVLFKIDPQESKKYEEGRQENKTIKALEAKG